MVPVVVRVGSDSVVLVELEVVVCTVDVVFASVVVISGVLFVVSSEVVKSCVSWVVGDALSTDVVS